MDNNNNQTMSLLSSLCRKLRREQSEYRTKLLSQPAPYILRHAQEYIIREKIISCIRLNILTNEQINAMLDYDNLLERIYERVSDGELFAVDGLIESIFEEADECADIAFILDALKVFDSDVDNE